MYYVLVMTVKNRKSTSIEMQKVLAEYGDIIRARLGLNETSAQKEEGLIILHLAASAKASTLARKLNGLKDVNAELVKIK